MPEKFKKVYLPSLLSISTVIIAYTYLISIGRNIICSCGYVRFWVGDILSSENSQQISDFYSFHHLLHGLAFFLIISKLLKKLSFEWQLFIAILIETSWEVFENSEFIINRFKQNPLNSGYNGDALINSFFDVIACIIGFYLARKLGIKKTLILFFIIEILSLILIKDSLILSIIMLIYPLKFISNWQAGL